MFFILHSNPYVQWGFSEITPANLPLRRKPRQLLCISSFHFWFKSGQNPHQPPTSRILLWVYLIFATHYINQKWKKKSSKLKHEVYRVWLWWRFSKTSQLICDPVWTMVFFFFFPTHFLTWMRQKGQLIAFRKHLCANTTIRTSFKQRPWTGFKSKEIREGTKRRALTSK